MDRSISMNRNFTNLTTKSLIASKNGDAAEAAKLRDEAFSIATEVELNAYGYQLMGQQKTDDATAARRLTSSAATRLWRGAALPLLAAPV